ncbi:MAG: hypothetical protein NTX42_11195 [Methanothrix sp.]|nr:hypothetical protein [Methanothrix sp.]
MKGRILANELISIISFGEIWMAEDKRSSKKDVKGTMTVQEAGRKGGMKTAQTHGKDFYEEIGHKGGQRVKELIEEGKRSKALSREKQ